MDFRVIIIVCIVFSVNCEKAKHLPPNKTLVTPKHYKHLVNKSVEVTNISDSNQNIHISNITLFNKSPHKVKIVPRIPKEPRKILQSMVEIWASNISEKLYSHEKQVVRREVLLKGFTGIKMEKRNGAATVDKMAAVFEDLLKRRVQAAENIMRRAEELAKTSTKPPKGYTFDRSFHLNEVKKPLAKPEGSELPLWCRGLRKLSLENTPHFDAATTLDVSSVHVAAEVYDCDDRIIPDIYWSEGLLSTFRQNYAQDAMMDFQYFCSAKGFLRHYPAASWESMFNLKVDFGESDDADEESGDVFDCRLRPWYVAAGGAPRDVLILYDGSGSMDNSTNHIHAQQFTLALLTALTDDDQVNVLPFNVEVGSLISCFNDKLVPANHINTAAMMAALKEYDVRNLTNMSLGFRESVRLLRLQEYLPDRPTSCQQVIILLTDAVERNYTDLMRELDPTGRIRLFVIWLHDEFGLRDSSFKYGGWLSCTSDGSLAELKTDADVTEQVMRILRVLERPLVGQRKERLTVFSDLYAHIEDPRRGEFYWRKKENKEQVYLFKELRKNKKKFLASKRLYDSYMRHKSLENSGHYYEGQDIKYRLQISVSVPVFDHTTSENITIILAEEKQRKSTRTYPVNRLLGVAGVDIPLEHLKLILPYHEVGAGGSLFIIDHRGNIILHDNIKPVFDGDILKPGYRTVDMLDLEQPGADLVPRNYSSDWLEFRNAIVIKQSKGNRTMLSKTIFDEGMRAIIERREYHWRRVLGHYTVVVALPKYNQVHALPDGAFTQELAASASDAFESDFSVHPDWLYCRHVDPYFEKSEDEVRHFVARRKDEPDFSMQNLKHIFSPIPIPLMEKTYQCNEQLMAHVCKEGLATAAWAEEHERPGADRDLTCELGSTTAFFATESGLTRWQKYHAVAGQRETPDGSVWPRGPEEAWYRRAAASPDTLVVHAPVAPIRKMRNSDTRPPPLGVPYEWMTAARILGTPEKGIIGVAGYHFYPKHLECVLTSITNFPCQVEDKEACEPRCDGEDWSCVLVDEGGWVVAGHWRDEEQKTDEDPIREHLARLHPQAMYALLTAGVFKLRWIHDYQGVCFADEESNAAALIPSLLRSIWHSVNIILHVTKEMFNIVALLSYSVLVGSDTEKEKQKQQNRTQREYERNKYDHLFDPRVLVNRTRFSACDRSRALYELQRTPKAMEALKRPPKYCSWPLAGAVVPKTNLLLLAVYNRCKHEGRPMPDPLVNAPVVLEYKDIMSATEWQELSPASQLACWRNRVFLPARPPSSACFPHNYTMEEGYRQCGPWLPDAVQDEED